MKARDDHFRVNAEYDHPHHPDLRGAKLWLCLVLAAAAVLLLSSM